VGISAAAFVELQDHPGECNSLPAALRGGSGQRSRARWELHGIDV